MQKQRRGRPKKLKDETKQGSKHIRMDSRTEWAIDLWAMAERTSDTAFIENAIDAYADALGKKAGISWRSTFHPHRAVCWLRAYLYESLPFPDDHQARRAFVIRHGEFFYRTSGDRMLVNAEFAAVLWGPCDDKNDPWKQIDAFRKTAGDQWAAGRAMARALLEADLQPPTWPPGDER